MKHERWELTDEAAVNQVAAGHLPHLGRLWSEDMLAAKVEAIGWQDRETLVVCVVGEDALLDRLSLHLKPIASVAVPEGWKEQRKWMACRHMKDEKPEATSAATYYLEYPPFSQDGIAILTQDQWEGDLPANHHYERIQIGERGEFPTLEALEAWVQQENHRRAYPASYQDQ